MVCGAVPTGGQVSVYLSADTSKPAHSITE